MTIPGNTRADLNAQAVAARSMFINANIYLPNCNKKDMHIIDTVPHGSSEDYLWEEIWIVEACGTKWQGIVEFWKDGSVSTGLKEPRFKQIK